MHNFPCNFNGLDHYPSFFHFVSLKLPTEENVPLIIVFSTKNIKLHVCHCRTAMYVIPNWFVLCFVNASDHAGYFSPELIHGNSVPRG